MRKIKTFEEWMAFVDHYINLSCGMWSNDLPDCCYRDWYDDNVTPKTAAKRAIKSANE